jgi:predicted DNA-binding ribbon-helix-helix protein
MPRVNVRLDEELYDRLARAAKRRGYRISRLVHDVRLVCGCSPWERSRRRNASAIRRLVLRVGIQQLYRDLVCVEPFGQLRHDAGLAYGAEAELSKACACGRLPGQSGGKLIGNVERHLRHSLTLAQASSSRRS